MSQIKPFEVAWTEAQVGAVLAKVRDYPWPPIPEVPDGWAYGCDAGYLKALCEHWTGAYDWRAVVKDLNRFPQFTARIEDFDIRVTVAPIAVVRVVGISPVVTTVVIRSPNTDNAADPTHLLDLCSCVCLDSCDWHRGCRGRCKGHHKVQQKVSFSFLMSISSTYVRLRTMLHVYAA